MSAATVCASAALMLAGCSTTVDGQAASMLYDPSYAGGLPAANGPSGIRDDAPPPTGTVRNTDGGAVDKLALLSLNDIEDFWSQTYSSYFNGTFTPVKIRRSYDSNNPASPEICREKTYQDPNAMFCPLDDSISWDRGVLLPDGERYFGDMSVPAVLAHEYGHDVQRMAGLVQRRTHTIVLEQQADCFSGVFMRWVAGGQSPRFTLGTDDGLDHVLAAAIEVRDPILTPETEDLIQDGHGSAFDRISAFQMGFVYGPTKCAAIDMAEIKQRRGDLPMVDPTDEPEEQAAVDEDTLSALMEVLGQIFSPQQPPTLAYSPANCPDAKAGPAASYCPATNTITVDLPALQKMGMPAGNSEHVLPQGNDTALSVVMSRYVLEVQRERGLPLASPWTALRTACLTGYVHRKMAKPIEVPSGNGLVLSPGDLDEAISGLLTNHLVATDVNGDTVPAGFTRIIAFRSGVVGEEQLCYARFPANST